MPLFNYTVDTKEAMSNFRLPHAIITGEVEGLTEVDALVNAFKKDKRLSDYIYYKWRTDFCIILHAIVLDDYKLGQHREGTRSFSEAVLHRFFDWTHEKYPHLDELDDESHAKYLPYLEDIKLMSSVGFTPGEIRILRRYMIDCDEYEDLASAIHSSPGDLFNAMQTLDYELIEALAELEICSIEVSLYTKSIESDKITANNEEEG